MCDEADSVAELEELERELALKNRSRNLPRHHTHCRWCKEPLPENHGGFCDQNCRDDWEKDNRNKQWAGAFRQEEND